MAKKSWANLFSKKTRTNKSSFNFSNRQTNDIVDFGTKAYKFDGKRWKESKEEDEQELEMSDSYTTNDSDSFASSKALRDLSLNVDTRISNATPSWTSLTGKPSAFTPPTSSTSVLGGVKVGTNLTISNGVLSGAAPYSKPSAEPISYISGLQSALNAKTTPGYVDAKVAALVASAPATLDTLNELAAALGDDANHVTTMTNLVATKLPLAGGTLTGNLTLENNKQLKMKDVAGNAHYTLYLDNQDTLVVGNGTGVDKIRMDVASNEGALVINSAGNVGLGVTPESWQSGETALQIGGTGAVYSETAASTHKTLNISQNHYKDTAHKYIISDFASNYYQYQGQHVFRVAPSGTADSAISWTTAMTITNTGNVGIGESTPEFPLEIGITSSTSQQVGFEITQATSGNDCRMRFKNAANGQYVRTGIDSGGTWYVEPYNGAYVRRLNIKTNGNVGIGTENPDSILHVVSQEISNGINKGIKLSNYNETKEYSIRTGITGAENTTLAFHDDTTGANRLVINSNGNVGIGTNSPSEKLQVAGNIQFGVGGGGLIEEDGTTVRYKNLHSGGTVNLMTHDGSEDIQLDPSGWMRFETGGKNRLQIEDNRFKFFNNSGGDGSLYTQGTSTTFDWQFNTYSTSNALKILNNGNVGIGISSPQAKLDISNGTSPAYYQVTQVSGNTAKFGIVNGSDIEISGTANNDIIFKRQNSEKLRITGSGIAVDHMQVRGALPGGSESDAIYYGSQMRVHHDGQTCSDGIVRLAVGRAAPALAIKNTGTNPALHIEGGVLKFPDGTTMTSAPSGVIKQTSAPSASNGDLWYDTDDHVFNIKVEGDWKEIVKGAPEGSSCDDAAVSGYQLKQDNPSLGSGNYSIKPSGGGCITMYVDMTREGGGYDFYACGGCSNHSHVTSGNSCPAGTDIVMSRSLEHWQAMYAFKGWDWYRNVGSVYKPSGGGNYTGCIMRSPSHYGSGCNDWRVKDGGRWYIRNSTHSEPNGDYSGNGWLDLYSGSGTNPGFNDGGAYSLGSNYVCSTNAKP